MSAHKKLPSQWFDNPSDKVFAQKSIGRGLGSVITKGPTLVEKLAAVVEKGLVCPEGHVEKFLDARDDLLCRVCKAQKIKARLRMAGDTEEDDAMPSEERMARGIARSTDDVPTGGTMDGAPIYTSKSKVRRPWTGDR